MQPRPDRPVERPITLEPARRRSSLARAIAAARTVAWRGETIDNCFGHALEFASAGLSSLVFVHGEYVGEIAIDPTERERVLPRGFNRIYHQFHPSHRFYHISDPRALAPGFERDQGAFPSRDTAAIALLEQLEVTGQLARFGEERALDLDALGSRVAFVGASLAAPWFRVTFSDRELGWVMIDRQRAVREGRWLYVGPNALEPRRGAGYHSRDGAALALLRAILAHFANAPARFLAAGSGGAGDPRGWNLTAADFARALAPPAGGAAEAGRAG